jgi:hypothetical protein
VQWLLVSIFLSLVLTLVVNIALAIFPELRTPVARWLAALTAPDDRSASTRHSRLRVIVPWKTMIIVSVLLTVLLNLLRWIR